jgi:signal transduction histidine kinase
VFDRLSDRDLARRIAGPHPWRIAAFTVLVAGLLAAFAWMVFDSQGVSRRQAQDRFAAEASITAQLTGSLFTETASSSEAAAAKAYGGATIDAKTLDAAVHAGSVDYIEILDADGAVIAASKNAPRGSPAKTAQVRAALAGTPMLSDALAGPGKSEVLEFALPFATTTGRRVAVEAFDAKPIFTFLNGYLAHTQGASGGLAVVLDSRSRIIATSSTTLKLGAKPNATQLVSALGSNKTRGVYHYTGERYFVAAPVPGSTWRVVLTATTAQLYPALAGSQSWVLLLVLGVLALLGVVSIVFLRRLFANGARIARANAELATLNATLEERVADRTAAAEERARELARSNEELEQFSSVASHDLQEPLRKIRMFGDRLRERLGDDLDQEAATDLARMSNAAERMQRLINDLLDFSRVTHRGKKFEPVDLRVLTDEVMSDLEARVAELDADVEVGNLPTIDADPTQMRQLMQNLIGNALKFHRADVRPTIRVHADVVPGQAPRFPGETTAGGRCVISVADNGIGFEEKHSERVFGAFERLHHRSEYEGTGIGLSIARKIAWRHGGHITANGAPNEGAIFTVTLPISQANGNGRANHNGKGELE